MRWTGQLEAARPPSALGLACTSQQCCSSRIACLCLPACRLAAGAANALSTDEHLQSTAVYPMKGLHLCLFDGQGTYGAGPSINSFAALAVQQAGRRCVPTVASSACVQ